MLKEILQAILWSLAMFILSASLWVVVLIGSAQDKCKYQGKPSAFPFPNGAQLLYVCPTTYKAPVSRKKGTPVAFSL